MFELRWGVHDVYGLNIDGYRENLENVYHVIPSMLKMFSDRNLKATWATVGAIGLSSWEEYFDIAPSPPEYKNKKLQINAQYADIDPKGKLHFAPNLVKMISETKGQELGSHSFSHLYFREEGVVVNDFIADSKTIKTLWEERYKVSPLSLVFPRNQVAFTSEFDNCGLKCWRGNEDIWYHETNTSITNNLSAKTFRFVDSINPWRRRSVKVEGANIRSSMFIRFNLPEPLWKLHVLRLKNELHTISSNNVFHIWWHPHNLGDNMPLRLHRLEIILDMVSEACQSNIVDSVCMVDCVDK